MCYYLSVFFQCGLQFMLHNPTHRYRLLIQHAEPQTNATKWCNMHVFSRGTNLNINRVGNEWNARWISLLQVWFSLHGSAGVWSALPCSETYVVYAKMRLKMTHPNQKRQNNTGSQALYFHNMRCDWYIYLLTFL